MITARFKKREKQIKSYSIEGHAGFSNLGTDIVCAAVSALSTALTNALLDHSIELEYTQDNGLLRVWLKSPNEVSQILCDTLEQGLKSIEMNYPDSIQVVEWHE